jgi:outer membrane protein assembly factor BamD
LYPYFEYMKRNIILVVLATLLLSSCGEYNKLLKSTDYDYKYEAAKCYYTAGKYSKAATLLGDIIMQLKGTDKAEESLYMLAMSSYNQEDYVTASHYFTTYYTSYQKGTYSELSRFMSGKALALDTPEPRLDQTNTAKAIQELQAFVDIYPQSKFKNEAQQIIYSLQDKLVTKEFYSAKLYYNLGTYMGNNYSSCIIVAQDALKDYPYTKLREELSILIVRSKYEVAIQSIIDKKTDRYRDAIDECYAFKNEFPESKYTKEVDKIFAEASQTIKTTKE